MQARGKRHLGGGTPRDFSPCGDVLDRNVPLLFTHWEQRYPYLLPATPLAEEGLLVPFYIGGKAVGTVWAMAHDRSRKFNAEDLRLLESLGRFASAAVESVGAFEQRCVVLNLMEDAVRARELAEDLNRQLRNEITEHKHAKEKLHESEERFRLMVEASPNGILMVEADGQITLANAGIESMFGYERSELIGQPIEILVPERHRAAHPAHRASFEAAPVARMIGVGRDLTARRKDGTEFPVEIGLAPIEMDKRRMVQCTVVRYHRPQAGGRSVAQERG